MNRGSGPYRINQTKFSHKIFVVVLARLSALRIQLGAALAGWRNTSTICLPKDPSHEVARVGQKSHIILCMILKSWSILTLRFEFLPIDLHSPFLFHHDSSEGRVASMMIRVFELQEAT